MNEGQDVTHSLIATVDLNLKSVKNALVWTPSAEGTSMSIVECSTYKSKHITLAFDVTTLVHTPHKRFELSQRTFDQILRFSSLKSLFHYLKSFVHLFEGMWNDFHMVAVRGRMLGTRK